MGGGGGAAGPCGESGKEFPTPTKPLPLDNEDCERGGGVGRVVVVAAPGPPPPAVA